jgi:hypothetical protein
MDVTGEAQRVSMDSIAVSVEQQPERVAVTG